MGHMTCVRSPQGQFSTMRAATEVDVDTGQRDFGSGLFLHLDHSPLRRCGIRMESLNGPSPSPPTTSSSPPKRLSSYGRGELVTSAQDVKER